MFSLFRRNNVTEDSDFLAEVSFVTKQTRFKTSVIICFVSKGSLNKNDTVVFLDKNKKVITEAIVSAINCEQKSVDYFEKSDTNSNGIGLEFRNVYDKPIEKSRFICKYKQA